MAFVVTAACFGCKNTECVEVCPTESFHEGEQMLFIDPDSCIDCCACQSACPVGAIFPDSEVPADQFEFIQLNAEMSQVTPSITQKKSA